VRNRPAKKAGAASRCDREAGADVPITASSGGIAPLEESRLHDAVEDAALRWIDEKGELDRPKVTVISPNTTKETAMHLQNDKSSGDCACVVFEVG
jgi:hypothetical protein